MSYKCLKLKLRVFVAGPIIAMVNNCPTKIIDSNMFTNEWQSFRTMISALADK